MSETEFPEAPPGMTAVCVSTAYDPDRHLMRITIEFNDDKGDVELIWPEDLALQVASQIHEVMKQVAAGGSKGIRTEWLQ